MTTTHAQRIAPATPPPSGRKPKANIASRYVAGLSTRLKVYHDLFTSLFPRPEQRVWSLKYMQGQMLELERKSIEPMARALEDGNVQAMQQFVSASPWQDQEIIRVHQREVGKTLGEEEGMLILDGSDFPKQGDNSVGVARQYCGALGKTANCQAAVFLAYASSHGHTLLDGRLYLPEQWFSPKYAAKREECEVPEDLTFQTKNAIGWSLLEPVLKENRLPCRWVLADEAFGNDSQLRQKVAAAEKYYFFEIPRDTAVFWRKPRMLAPPRYSGVGRPASKPRLVPDAEAPIRVDELAPLLKPKHWHRVIVKEGSKGPLIVEVAIFHLVFAQAGLPIGHEWLVIRRKSAQQSPAKWKFFRSNAPNTISWKTLARLTAWRWPIETTFEECKGELGMDHYEVRNWRGWHHHITMTLLSHHFLVRTRIEMGDDMPALTLAQTRRLLSVILPKREFDEQAVLAEIQRTQEQNYAAYRSHRKRRLRRQRKEQT